MAGHSDLSLNTFYPAEKAQREPLSQPRRPSKPIWQDWGDSAKREARLRAVRAVLSYSDRDGRTGTASRFGLGISFFASRGLDPRVHE